MTLTAVLALSIDRLQTWRYASWSVVAIAGLIPIALSGIKLLSMAIAFGPQSALAYRWHPTELGGANLVARSVLCVVPLALALVQGTATRRACCLRWGMVGGSAFVMLYTRSWEGLFAWLAMLGVYGSLAHWEKLSPVWRRLAGLRPARWIAIAAAIILILLVATVAVRAASLLNPYSFNGRIMHWYGAVLAWRDHPFVGAGPAVESSYTPYSGQVDMVLDTQATMDAPLRVIEINGEALNTHAHNLYLEIGAGTGVLGFASFAGLLLAMVLLGLRVWRGSNGAPRLWAAGCLAGIAGALLWGVMDVLSVTPPFFSFPIWGLAGLLLALDRLKDPASYPVDRVWRSPTYAWGIVALAVAFVLRPAFASASYASGFEALQEQRWKDARSHLGKAACFRPLDPRPRQLMAEACLGAGDTACAALAYERASELRQDYSPYYSQLGWLAWLNGDLDQAVAYFQAAVEADPDEAWRDGLHADLGLTYAAQGLAAEAVAAFQKTLELNPHMAAAPYWRKVQRPDSRLENVLDPVYVAGSSQELEQRIRAHLGVAGYTERQTLPVDLAGSPLSLNDVLDGLEDDYQAARAVGSRKAPLLLAALADASRTAHLADRAEQSYRDFQALEPQSAHGFRELGILYRQLGRLEHAQAVLELAVKVSPSDAASWYNLALTYLDLGVWPAAEQALDVITGQAFVSQFHSHLFDPELYAARARLQMEKADLTRAVMAQYRMTLIRQWPSDYLGLADLHRQTERAQKAVGQCVTAADVLIRVWPRPLDPELWSVGRCFAQAGTTTLPSATMSLAGDHPLVGNILLGHIHRAQGQLDQALVAYQRAAAARPDEGGPHYFLGETYQALGQLQPAGAEYRRAAELDPLESLPLLALGRLQWSQGQARAALESYRAAVEVNPGWGPAHAALGNALLALGDRDGAAEHYRLAQTVTHDLQEGQIYDFAAHLAEAEIRSPGPDQVRHDYFDISGDARRVLFMHPDSSARYTVQVPEGAHLAFDVATAPESWEQPGDGVSFTISIEPVAHLASDSSVSNPLSAFSTYIDPKHDPSARRWHPHSIDLGAYAGQAVTLTFETSAGPVSDDRYDWAGWGRPRLFWP